MILTQWEAMLLILDASLAVVATAIWSVRRKVHKFHAQENTPPYLGQVRIIETKYHSRYPNLICRVDRVFRRGRQVTVCETKTRPGTFILPRDVLQMSIQRICVKNQALWSRIWFKHPLIGYVRCVHPQTGNVSWKSAELLSERWVKTILKRYHYLQKHPSSANPSTRSKDCKNCGVRYKCKHINK